MEDFFDVSTKQKWKIRFREVLSLCLIIGCGMPVYLSIFESFFVLSPVVLLILGAFAFAAAAHFLMTDTWDENCEGSFCYGNKSLSNYFNLGKLAILLFTPVGGVSTIALGLFQILNPAVALVLGTISLAIFMCHFWLFNGQSKNDKNKENPTDARKDDSELSERKWLKFMTVMYPIACVLLLLSALVGTLPFTTALISCMPFGGIGLCTGICFLWSKHHKPSERFFLNENYDISGQDSDKSVQQVTPGEIYDNAPPALASQNQNQFNNVGLQQYPDNNIYQNSNVEPELPSLEEIEKNQKHTSDKNELDSDHIKGI